MSTRVSRLASAVTVLLGVSLFGIPVLADLVTFDEPAPFVHPVPRDLVVTGRVDAGAKSYAKWIAGRPAREEAKRQAALAAQRTVFRPVSVAGTRANGSSNPYVNPWGCEASHAQQWSPSGKYWGKYQFDRQTWAAHGGTNYGSASEAEQDRVAARVQYDAWPNC